MTPGLLDTLFPPKLQQNYITALQRKDGLTRRRAECLIRLWGYLLLKLQAEELNDLPQPLLKLELPQGFVICTHREAAELFYAQEERGSDRAAGLMIDRLVALQFLEKNYDGQTLSLQVRPIPELLAMLSVQPLPALQVDAFNPRTDAVLVAQLMTRTYQDWIKNSGAAAFRMSKGLRVWASQYNKGMRVLRRSDTLNPVGIMILYPTASQSEPYFFQTPNLEHLWTDDRGGDRFEMASPGDLACTSVYVRAWIVDTPYASAKTLCQFIQETQRTLLHLQEDFPSLCDLYAILIQPNHAALRQLMGFERVLQNSQQSQNWVYISLDRYLSLDPEQIVSGLLL